MIMRVAFNVLSGKGADDSRSDDEELVEDTIDGVETGQALDMPPLEKEVEIEDLTWNRRSSPIRKTRKGKTGARTSAISIAGHSEPKELLGRIGCDKPT